MTMHLLTCAWHWLTQVRAAARARTDQPPRDVVLSVSRQAAIAAIAARTSLRSALQPCPAGLPRAGRTADAITQEIDRCEHELSRLRMQQTAAEADAARLLKAEQDVHNGRENAP